MKMSFVISLRIYQSIIVVSFLVVLNNVQTSESAECQKQGDCSCSVGSYYVDLGTLVNSASSGPTFDNIKGEDDATYSYKPCHSYTQGDPGGNCDGVSACQHATNGEYFCLAKEHTSKFTGDPGQGNLQVEYNCTGTTGDNNNRLLTVFLRCGSTKLTVKGETEPGKSLKYEMTLYTQLVCSKGLSPGSILLILLFVAVLVYLILGVLFLKFVRGARGVELIPNYEFWKEFPVLVKDGTVFAVGGCKSDQTYEKI